MKLHAELTFPAVPATVMAMLTDPAYVRRRCEAAGGSAVEVAVEPDASGAMVVTSRQTLPTEGFPSMARSMLGDGLRVTQIDRWEAAGPGSWKGSSSVAAGSLPGTVAAALTLDPEGAGSRQVADGDVKVSVPLIGAKLEKMISEQVQNFYTVEKTVAAEWLARA